MVSKGRSITSRSRVEPAQSTAERDRIRDPDAVEKTRVATDRPGAVRAELAGAPARQHGLIPELVSVADSAIPRVIRNHRRFALTDVTFDGGPVGGATVDAWQNAAGADCWSARVLMVPTDGLAGGALVGRTRDGRLLRGLVSRGATGPAPRPRGAAIVEWYGIGVLRADPPAEDA